LQRVVARLNKSSDLLPLIDVEAIVDPGVPDPTLDSSYVRHFADLVRLCEALGAGADSEDVAQETLVFARAHIQDMRDPTKLRGWLRTIAVRKIYRLKADRTASLGVETVSAPLDSDLGLDLANAIARLPQRERGALTLVYGLGYSQEEAAQAMGIRRGTVAAELAHARSKLAHWLADYVEDGRR
jgi:RNA polymerase sigma factor, sigma-70 family